MVDYTLILDGHIRVKVRLNRAFNVGDAFSVNGILGHVTSSIQGLVHLSSAPPTVSTPVIRRFKRHSFKVAANDD